jgi:transposase
MLEQRDKACGVDVHRDSIVATILSRAGKKDQREFGTTISELFEFRDWLSSNECRVVALESTGTYWIPIYTVLEEGFEVIVANPYMIKHIRKRKKDQLDSEWIAELCLNDQIAPSRIFPKEDWELRMLTRTREGLIKIRTNLKNRIHRDLASANIKLASVVTDIFGKSGMHCLIGKLLCQDVDEIIRTIPSGQVRKKADEIREAILADITQVQILSIKISLSLIESLNQKIQEIDAEIQTRIMNCQKEMEIVMSVPGIDFVSGTTILAEIGNYRDFTSPEKLAAYFGLVPYVYQSAGKLYTGPITKQGSKHLRWIMVQVAHAASRVKNSMFRRVFLRIRGRRGHNVAIVALARKILCIIYHLLINQEMYEEKKVKKLKPSKPGSSKSSSQIMMTLEEMIEIVRQSGYLVNQIDRGACG